MIEKIIIVVGVPGSGKSTALEKIESEIPNSKVINLGTEMFKRSQFKDRDEIRKNPNAKAVDAKIRKEIFEELLRQGCALAGSGIKTVIIDMHAVVKNPDGYNQGISDEGLKLLGAKLKAIINITAEPRK